MISNKNKYDSSIDMFLNPVPFLESLKGKQVIVKLKWGHEYRGVLYNYDDYFNIQIKKVQEWINDNLKGELDEMLIRCNNILYIREDDS